MVGDERRGRRWRCGKCGQYGIAFDGCGMSECEAVTVLRGATPPVEDAPRDAQPARLTLGEP